MSPQKKNLLVKIIGYSICSLIFYLPLPAQEFSWPVRIDSVLKQAERANVAADSLLANIHSWKRQVFSHKSGRLTSAQQYALYWNMAQLIQNFEKLQAFSDEFESARRLSPENFYHRYVQSSPPKNSSEVQIKYLSLLRTLLLLDRTWYSIVDSLLKVVDSSGKIKERVNEGNRAFRITSNIFRDIRRIFYNPSPRLRLRSRFRQLEKFIARFDSSDSPKLFELSQNLLADPILQQIADQSHLSIVMESSGDAFGAAFSPIKDLAPRTIANISRIVGNLTGSYIFWMLDFFRIGKAEGHALPAFCKYFPHPDGVEKGVNPIVINNLEKNLKAGDILFEKSRFAITDKLIPGYFGHVAIYLQDYEVLKKLGVFETKEFIMATNNLSKNTVIALIDTFAREMQTIKQEDEWLKFAITRQRFFRRKYNGTSLNPLVFETLYRLKYQRQNVLESLRNGQLFLPHKSGVTLNEFKDFLYVDDFAAIRLKPQGLNKSDYNKNLARFLALAILQYSKPYDFRYDVNTVDEIVCSELIYRSFINIDFQTVQSLTSFTISPDDIASKAGIITDFEQGKIDPPFQLVQWYWEGIPLFPQIKFSKPKAEPSREINIADSLIIHAFMMQVGPDSLKNRLLTDLEQEQFDRYKDLAQQLLKPGSSYLQTKKSTRKQSDSPNSPSRNDDLEISDLNIQNENRFINATDTSENKFDLLNAEKVKRLDSASHSKKNGYKSLATYSSDYINLYSRKKRFFLALFHSGKIAYDRNLGTVTNLQFAGNNDPPLLSLNSIQYYSFLPVHLQIYWEQKPFYQHLYGGVALARISRRDDQGDFIEMTALDWRSSFYKKSFTPFIMELDGDKGPIAGLLKLARIGNGDYLKGLFFSEHSRIEIVECEYWARKRALTLAKIHYGAGLKYTYRRIRLFSSCTFGTRIGNFYDRDKFDFSVREIPIFSWGIGLEFFQSSLYRPISHRLEFRIFEDDAFFCRGKIAKKRQISLSYRVSFIK